MKIDIHEAIFKMTGDELSSIVETVKLREINYTSQTPTH